MKKKKQNAKPLKSGVTWIDPETRTDSGEQPGYAIVVASSSNAKECDELCSALNDWNWDVRWQIGLPLWVSCPISGRFHAPAVETRVDDIVGRLAAGQPVTQAQDVEQARQIAKHCISVLDRLHLIARSTLNLLGSYHRATLLKPDDSDQLMGLLRAAIVTVAEGAERADKEARIHLDRDRLLCAARLPLDLKVGGFNTVVEFAFGLVERAVLLLERGQPVLEAAYAERIDSLLALLDEERALLARDEAAKANDRLLARATVALIENQVATSKLAIAALTRDTSSTIPKATVEDGRHLAASTGRVAAEWNPAAYQADALVLLLDRGCMQIGELAASAYEKVKGSRDGFSGARVYVEGKIKQLIPLRIIKPGGRKAECELTQQGQADAMRLKGGSSLTNTDEQ